MITVSALLVVLALCTTAAVYQWGNRDASPTRETQREKAERLSADDVVPVRVVNSGDQ